MRDRFVFICIFLVILIPIGIAHAAFGNFIFSFDGDDGPNEAGGGDGDAFTNVRDVAVDSNDRIITANLDDNPALRQIQIYTSTGTFVAGFDGSDGAGTAFTAPRGVAVDSIDRIIVTDVGIDLVQIYDSTGVFVAAFDGSNGGTAFVNPEGVASDSSNRIIVADITVENS